MMSRHAGRNAQRLIQSKIGFVSVAALLCLSGPAKLTAQPGDGQTPQQSPQPIQPAQPVDAEGSGAPASPAPAAPQTPTAQQPPAPGAGPATPEAAAMPEATPLPPVQVTGTPPRPARPQQATTPAPQPTAQAAPAEAPNFTPVANPGYLPAAGAGGISRLTAPLLSTPQTVNVVTQTLIREQNSGTVAEALRNVAGITFRAGEGGNQGDTPYIRGFSAQNDVFRDTVRDPGWYTRDTFAVDAVEVYKGPASFLFGRGSTGGVINLISKLPQERTFVEGSGTVNSGPGMRATVDANGKMTDTGYGPVWARVVAMGQLYDIPGRDHVSVNRYGVSPSIMWKPTADTKLTLWHIYQHDFSIPDYGIPFLSAAWGFPRVVAPVPRGTWYGILSGPTPDTEIVDSNITTLRLEHNFSSGLKFMNTTRYNQVDRLQRNVFPEPNANVPAPPNLNADMAMNRAEVNVTNTQFANQSELRANFWTGPIFEHTVVGALDYSVETRNFVRNQYANPGVTTITPTNFIDPNPWRFGGFIQPPASNQLLYGKATDVAAYIADQIKITKWFELLGGVRAENYNFVQDAPLAGPDPRVKHLESNNNLVSWRVGAVFHPTKNTSIYAMKGTSFNPSADNLSIAVGTTAAGNLNAFALAALPPEKTETTEVGAKADVLDNKLALQTAVFHTVKTNMRVPDPSNNSVTVLAGAVTADGFEASAAGNITKEWAVITTLAYIHARVTKTLSPAQLGAEPVNTPTWAYSLWTTYDVTPKLQIGGGAFYTGQWWSDLATTAPANSAYVPAYWRFDAMAAYKLSPKVTLQFNIYNLTDKFYAAAAYTNWFMPGPSRTFALTVRAAM
jgi:catecholate siderophore receptor